MPSREAAGFRDEMHYSRRKFEALDSRYINQRFLTTVPVSLLNNLSLTVNVIGSMSKNISRAVLKLISSSSSNYI